MPRWNRNDPLRLTGCKCIAGNGFILPSLLQCDGVAATCGKATPACSNRTFPYAFGRIGFPVCIDLNAINTRRSCWAKEAGEVISRGVPSQRHIFISCLFCNGGSRRQERVTSSLPPESKLWYEVTTYAFNTKDRKSNKD